MSGGLDRAVAKPAFEAQQVAHVQASSSAAAMKAAV
jgi:hypothetical protein